MRTGSLAAILVLALAGCSGRPPLAPEPAGPSVDVIDARAGIGFARVDWQVRNGGGSSFVVLRRHADQPWKVRATLAPDGGGRMALEDRAVLPGEPYGYGVLIPGRRADDVHATVTIEVPGTREPVIDPP